DPWILSCYILSLHDALPIFTLLQKFQSPFEALEILKSGEVDLLFLDIQMPDITGLEFLKSLEKKPLVIFTTAYDQYALEGYNLRSEEHTSELQSRENLVCRL